MKIATRRHPHPEIPLVSTADVAFLLLIFFLSTTILNVERGIVLTLPGTGERVLVAEGTRVADLAVASDESLRLDGRPVPAGRLRDAVAGLLARDPNVLLRITVGPRAPYEALVGALDQVKLAGARQISLRTEPGP